MMFGRTDCPMARIDFGRVQEVEDDAMVRIIGHLIESWRYILMNSTSSSIIPLGNLRDRHAAAGAKYRLSHAFAQTCAQSTQIHIDPDLPL